MDENSSRLPHTSGAGWPVGAEPAPLSFSLAVTVTLQLGSNPIARPGPTLRLSMSHSVFHRPAKPLFFGGGIISVQMKLSLTVSERIHAGVDAFVVVTFI